MTKFELADTLFAKANVRHTDKVYLWLGVRFHRAQDSATPAVQLT